MPRLIWSPRALRDVSRLHAFLKPKSPAAAARAVKAIREGVRLLAAHPEAERPAEDMEPAFREWPISFGAGGYVALYRYDSGVVIGGATWAGGRVLEGGSPCVIARITML